MSLLIFPRHTFFDSFRLSYLNPYKILEFPQVLSLKVAEEMLFQPLNTIMIIARDNNVINIDNQINALP